MNNSETELLSRLLQGTVEGDEELAVAQHMLQLLMDSLASAVFWKDRDSAYLGCNRAFADLAGRTVDDMRGKDDRDMPWFDHTDGYLEWDQRVINNGTSHYDIVESLRSADGIEMWIATNKVPLRNSEGEIVGVLGSFRDITDRVRAEAELNATLGNLDRLVTERTKELAAANSVLKTEVQERERLAAEERRMREQAEARRRVSIALSRTLDLDAVLDALVEGMNSFGHNDLVAVLLAEGHQNLKLARVDAAPDYEVLDRNLAPQTLTVLEQLGGSTQSARSGSGAKMLGPGSSTLAASMTTGGQLVGYIILESRLSDAYQHADIEQMSEIADQAAAVISNIGLTTTLEANAADRERERLARELHDSVVQKLAATSLAIDSELDQISAHDPRRAAMERIQRMARAAHLDSRALLTDTTPSEPKKLDLIALINRHIENLEVPEGTALTTSLSRPRLEDSEVVVIYQILREALSNVLRHANATEVSLNVSTSPRPTVTITDNGGGFDPEAVPVGHIGLRIMADRAKEANLKLTITTAPGKGTTVAVSTDRAGA